MPKRLTTFLDRAQRAGLIEEEAIQTILNLADPFPDTALQATGWPDIAGQNTVPVVLTNYLNIAAPASVTTTWNFKVVFLPFTGTYNSLQYNNWAKTTGAITGASAVPSSLGQFNVWTWRAEDPEPNWVTVNPTQTITLDSESDWGSTRLCAAGFEAINTSTTLYKGGMYYGWRGQEYCSDMNISLNSNPASSTLSRYRLLTGVAPSLNRIINQNTTVSGSAVDGVGVFALPTSVDNPAVITLPTNLFLVDDLAAGTPSVRIPTTASLVNSYPWTTCGAYVTGLAQQATFQLKARCFYENIPSADSPSMMQAIARPPVPHSFLALELMAKMLATMPCGFDYKENPFGEWFAKVLDVLSTVVPAIGAVIPHPVAKGIAAVAGPALAQGASLVRTHKAEKKKAKALLAQQNHK